MSSGVSIGVLHLCVDLLDEQLERRGGVAVLVLLDGVADVEWRAGADVLEVRRHVEGYAVDYLAACVVHELQLYVLQILAHKLACAEVLHAHGAERGLLVAGAEGVEQAQRRHEFRRYLREVDYGVDVDLRGELLRQDVGRHVLLEAAGELVDVLHLHRQAHGVGVAAEVLQEVAHGVDGLVDVESLHGARRAGGEPVGEGQHHGRLVVQLGQAGGHDAYDALVPALVVYDDGALGRVHLAARLEYGVGLLGDLLVQLLAVLVVLVDGEGQLGGVLGVACGEELHGLTAALHPARGVDARSYLEDDVADGDFLAAEAAGADDGAQAHVGVAVEALEAGVCHDAVLVDHGHDVGGDADGHQVEHGLELGGAYAVADAEGLHELVAHAASAEVGAGVGGAFQLGVEDGGCRRQLLVGHVVVADDEVDAQLLGVGYLLVGLDAAVEDDDKLHALLGGQVDGGFGDAVALIVARGDVVVYLGVVVLQVAVHERHGRRAVHVVVSVDHDSFFGPHRSVEPVYSLVHVGHEEGVVEVAQRRMEKFLSFGNRTNASLHQQFAYRRDGGKPSCELCLELLFFCSQGQVIPFTCHLCSAYICNLIVRAKRTARTLRILMQKYDFFMITAGALMNINEMWVDS